MAPRVSLLLPNLNNRPYLEERMRSISAQTLTDWELIVVDSHSSDGAWEYFLEWARSDPRIRLYQSDERGIYVNFNRCLELATGEYVYFATSDDTMEAHALEELVRALDQHPDCDLAHCKLRIIDENGAPSRLKQWDDFFNVRYFGDLIERRHIRRAPHDGVLHFAGITAYTSLTQLLIRRRLFQRIGPFLTGVGAIADFEWEMRATLTAHTIHVPEYLAAWRFHSRQATSDERMNRAKGRGAFQRMADHAVRQVRRWDPATIESLDLRKLGVILRREWMYHELSLSQGWLRRGWSIVRWLLRDPGLLWEFHRARRAGRAFVAQPETLAFLKEAVREHGLEKNLIPCDEH